MNQLVEIISSDELNVKSEEMVYKAVMNWIKYDLNERNSDKNAKIFINCIDAVAGFFRYFLKNSNKY